MPEHFQWLAEEKSRQLPPDQLSAVSHELADVLLYLVQVADSLGVDLMQAAQDELALNAIKCLVEPSESAHPFNPPQAIPPHIRGS